MLLIRSGTEPPESFRGAVRVSCPPPNDLENLHADTALTAALRKVDWLYATGLSTFGVECKSQMLVECGSGKAATRKIFQRPAQEPVILSYARYLIEGNFEPESCTTLVSSLSGKVATLRTTGIFVRTEDDIQLSFEPPDPTHGWMREISSFEERRCDWLPAAAYRYARIVFAHPFSDGNGRFARAALYGALAKSGLLRYPALGLGAVFDAHRAELSLATLALASTGDWPPYVRLIERLLVECCHLSIEAARLSGPRDIDLG